MALKSDNRLLKILSADEIAGLYSHPQFDEQERQHYFFLSPVEAAAMADWPMRSRGYAILQLGYFKARQQFFPLTEDTIATDLSFIAETYLAGITLDSKIANNTRTKQQRMILRLCDYRACHAVERKKLEVKATQLARVSTKPIFIFRELLNWLDDNQIVLPAYSYFQLMIGRVLEREKQRLIQFAQQQVRPMETILLRQLLTRPDKLYEVTKLKRSPRDFGFNEMKREIARGEQIRDLYDLARQVIPRLGISNEAVNYYASLVGYYSAYRLRTLNPWLVDVYLLCFVFHRYQRFQDNLIGYFIHQVRGYVDDAKQIAKELLATFQLERNRNLQRTGSVLRLLAEEDSFSAETPFSEVQAAIFDIVDRKTLKQVADQLSNTAKLDETELQWSVIESKSHEFKRRLRRVIRIVPFATASASDPLLITLDFLKRAFQSGRALTQYTTNAIPTAIIPDSACRYLYKEGSSNSPQLHTDRYEFFVYRQLLNRLEAGDLFCRVSTRYRSLEDDLLSDGQWRQKEILIAQADLPLLQRPIRQQLTELEARLENRFTAVNERIVSGDNVSIELNKHDKTMRWKLTQAKMSVPVNHPFFDDLPLLDIHTLLHMVDQQTDFMSSFDHVLHRYAARDADKHILVAALVAWATNLGLGRMGTISDINAAALSGTSSSFIRLETLQAANDVVVNALAQLSLFPLYHIDGTVHSSSDGQKFETRLHTFNARHSPKYFGLQKGVVAYTLVANHIPVRARIIGANEHESHYVFDLLHNNTTAVQPTIHSTDTHGTNQVNFALLHFFGYQFAPRYKDIYDKVRTSLYGFHHPSHYADMVIRPIRKLQPELIVDEWEYMQRILLSLALKTTTQSVIVSKLNSFTRRNRTKKALWEFDNIIASLYLLDYIDLISLRSNVYRALNRGESYHQLRRAVSYANFGKLRFKTEYEQQIWNECCRLITNCIIYYNAMLLSKILELKQAAGDTMIADQLKRISPVAWSHLNFHGRYEFSKIPKQFDLDALAERLASRPIPRNE